MRQYSYLLIDTQPSLKPDIQTAGKGKRGWKDMRETGGKRRRLDKGWDSSRSVAKNSLIERTALMMVCVWEAHALATAMLGSGPNLVHLISKLSSRPCTCTPNASNSSTATSYQSHSESKSVYRYKKYT